MQAWYGSPPTPVLERNRTPGVIPTPQQRASRCEEAEAGPHINPEAFRAAGFHSVKRSTGPQLPPARQCQSWPACSAERWSPHWCCLVWDKHRSKVLTSVCGTERDFCSRGDEAGLLAHWVCTLPQSFSKLAAHTMQLWEHGRAGRPGRKSVNGRWRAQPLPLGGKLNHKKGGESPSKQNWSPVSSREHATGCDSVDSPEALSTFAQQQQNRGRILSNIAQLKSTFSVTDQPITRSENRVGSSLRQPPRPSGQITTTLPAAHAEEMQPKAALGEGSSKAGMEIPSRVL